MKSKTNATHHELWKGLILGIRILPANLSTEALIEVKWFWSRHDIEELFEKKEMDIPDCMSMIDADHIQCPRFYGWYGALPIIGYRY